MKGFRNLNFSLLAAALLGGASSAAAVEVNASLTQETTGVGQPVQLNIEVKNARGAQPPRTIQAEGLEIRYQGQSTQVQVVNMQMTMTTTFNYLVIPREEGTFEIPALDVTAAGRAFRTPPLRLQVRPGAEPPAQPAQPHTPYRPQQPPQSQQPPPAPDPRADRGAAPEEIAFAELIVPAETAFVGQTVPVEIRMYFDSRYRFEISRMPAFSGEGFTVERLSEPVERRENLGGVPYNVYIFHSAISPVRTGLLEIEPATLECTVRVQSRGSSMFDDFFGDFFGGPMPGMGERRRITLRSNGAELEAKPLPREDRPDSFAGAIGQFTLTGGVTPEKVSAGEPVTLQWTIEGRGNFNSVSAPVLTNGADWRTYPASSSFDAFDTIGFSGAKTFDIMMVATTETNRTPGGEFSYFDPVEERYVTLTHEPFDVEVDGVARVPAVVGDDEDAPAQFATAPDEAAAVAVRLEPARRLTLHRFTPVPLRTEFLVANGAAAVGLGSLLVYFLLNSRMAGAAAERRRIRQARRHALRALDERGLTGRDFAARAVAYLAEVAGVDAARDVQTLRGLDEQDREAVHRLLRLHEELTYAPGGAGDFPASERTRVIAALKHLEESDAWNP